MLKIIDEIEINQKLIEILKKTHPRNNQISNNTFIKVVLSKKIINVSKNLWYSTTKYTQLANIFTIKMMIYLI